MGNVVYKLTSKEIQSLMAQTTFETTKLPQGMKARTRYQNTVINISILTLKHYFARTKIGRASCRERV